MERAFFTMRLKPGMEEQYDRNHKAVWPSVLAAIERCGVRAYSIFREGLTLYFYIEAEDFQRSMTILNADAEHTRWNKTYAYMFESTANPTSGQGESKLVPEVFRLEAAPPRS